MQFLNLLLKPSSFLCNLDCEYCFYKRVESLYPSEASLMSIDTARVIIQKALSLGAVRNSFCWQGGEPTLCGLDFYREVLALQKRYAQPHQHVENSIQTNGYLLDDEWADFLRQNRILVGLSLDGPKDIHNRYRKSFSGGGTFDAVRNSMALLKKRRAPFNVLTLLSDANVHYPEKVYSFFRRNGVNHLQFIPCLERDPQTGRSEPFAISGEDLGAFYSTVFDLWVKDGFPTVSIRLFEDILIYWLDGNKTSCSWLDRCDSYLLIEHNGDCYPCDFFVYPEWKLGNLIDDSFETVLRSPLRKRFAEMKTPVPPQCLQCRWRAFCQGDCTRYRRTPKGDYSARSELCRAWTILLEHMENHPCNIRDMALQARADHQKNAGRKIGRNDPCPCGSGLKYKKCCLRS